MQSTPAEWATPAEARRALAQACHSLWLATLSLMTAYMHNNAPAHRLLLARRIARNFATLRDEDCFGPSTRAHFAKLARRWERTADGLSPEGAPAAGVFLWLQRLFAR